MNRAMQQLMLERHGMPYNTRKGEARIHGEIIDLGFGVAPKSGRFGDHPLFWYVAMGYLSGFPVRHVFWWVWRFKLSPRGRREERDDAALLTRYVTRNGDNTQ